MNTTYMTVQGDTWDLIAYKVYSNAYLSDFLIEVNPEHRLIAIFGGGITLKIPEKPKTINPLKKSPWKEQP